MARQKKAEQLADSQHNAVEGTGLVDFPPKEEDIFDQQIAANQAAAQQVVNETAESMRMPPAQPSAPQPSSNGTHADKVGKREYKPQPDPFGAMTVALSSDPDGPQARLLRSREHQDMWIQFSENPGKEYTSQIGRAGFDWQSRAHSDFAKGAWVLPLEEGREWQAHAKAEKTFIDVVNQIRDKNGMGAFVTGAAQSF